MSSLFDRYFQVFFGRVGAADCGTLVTVNPECDAFILEWPLDDTLEAEEADLVAEPAN